MSMNKVEKIDDQVGVKHVLISVSDKSGLEVFVPRLLAINPQLRIFSTGGTFARLKEILAERADACLTQVSDYTGQPETQGGLVKTLDFKIYLGLLTETYNPDHHAVQLAVIKAMNDANPDLIIGMEMFDHTYQPVLDQWTAGTLSEEEFIERTHWYANWRFNYDQYRDILEYAKEKKIRIIVKQSNLKFFLLLRGAVKTYISGNIQYIEGASLIGKPLLGKKG